MYINTHNKDKKKVQNNEKKSKYYHSIDLKIMYQI